MPGPKAAVLILTADERAELARLVRRAHGSQALVTRARTVLACAKPGATSSSSGEAASPSNVQDEDVERLLVLTLETQPKYATHWSTRSMAARAGLSQTMVSRVWRALGLQPHRQETFKLSQDPAFVDKVRDVVGLYLRPPDRALVLCVDEKPQIQALERTAPCCRCVRANRNAIPMTTSGRAPWTFLPRSMSKRARSSVPDSHGTAAPSSVPSWTPSTHGCQGAWRCT